VYPTFLATYAKLTPRIVGLIGVLYGIGSIAGGFVFGALSKSGAASGLSPSRRCWRFQ
jgi:predicted MFS family arabinose efflux permease